MEKQVHVSDLKYNFNLVNDFLKDFHFVVQEKYMF